MVSRFTNKFAAELQDHGTIQGKHSDIARAWRVHGDRSVVSLRYAPSGKFPGPVAKLSVRSGLLRIEGDRMYLRFALAYAADG